MMQTVMALIPMEICMYQAENCISADRKMMETVRLIMMAVRASVEELWQQPDIAAWHKTLAVIPHREVSW